MDIYGRIDSILKDKKMSRRKLAGLAEIPYSSLISAFNRKSNSFSMDYVQKIATVLDCSVDYLSGKVPYPHSFLVDTKGTEQELKDFNDTMYIGDLTLEEQEKIWEYKDFLHYKRDYPEKKMVEKIFGDVRDNKEADPHAPQD